MRYYCNGNSFRGGETLKADTLAAREFSFFLQERLRIDTTSIFLACEHRLQTPYV